MIENAPFNLANLIAGLARRHPQRAAITCPDVSVNYAQLRDLAAHMAERMRQLGVRRGACVALDINHPVVAIALTLACAFLGCSWVRGSMLVLNSKDLSVSHLLHDGVRYPATATPAVLVDSEWIRIGQAGKVAPFEGYVAPNDAWMIAQSSGTTGTPKFMVLSEIVTSRRATESISAVLPPEPVYLCLFHPLTKPGILHVLRVLVVGGTVMFGRLETLFGRTRIDCVLGAPNHFAGFLANAPAGSTRITQAVIAGAVARRPFLARMLRYFETISYVYASTEASIVCTNLLRTVEGGQGAVSAGRPLLGVQVRIVAEDGSELPPGQEGIVKLRTPWQVSGYIGNPELTAQVFRDGWFHPGDLGYLTAEGELFITGRVNDQLNVGGVKINPDTIDEIIQSTTGIRDGACFVQPGEHDMDQLAAALVVDDPQAARAAVTIMRGVISAKFGPSLVPKTFFVLPSIPRNQNGKLDRAGLSSAVRGVTAFQVAPTIANNLSA